MIEKIFLRVMQYADKFSRVSVNDPARISPNSSIKGAVILGDVTIDDGVKISKGVKIDGRVRVGRFSSINGPNTDILAMVECVEIGAFCSIARNVSIQEFNHHADRLATYFIHHNIFKTGIRNDVTSKGPIVIGNDVWIGTQSVVLSGVKIGDGAIIAANSVITTDVPAYSIVAGSPARVIRMRFSDEVIERLKALKWWEWPMPKIAQNKEIFSQPLTVELLEQVK